MTTQNTSEDANKAPVSGDSPPEASITIVEPWPLIRAVSDDECWERMSDADIQLLGMGRDEWEKQFGGNPCSDPRLQ